MSKNLKEESDYRAQVIADCEAEIEREPERTRMVHGAMYCEGCPNYESYSYESGEDPTDAGDFTGWDQSARLCPACVAARDAACPTLGNA